MLFAPQCALEAEGNLKGCPLHLHECDSSSSARIPQFEQIFSCPNHGNPLSICANHWALGQRFDYRKVSQDLGERCRSVPVIPVTLCGWSPETNGVVLAFLCFSCKFLWFVVMENPVFVAVGLNNLNVSPLLEHLVATCDARCKFICQKLREVGLEVHSGLIIHESTNSSTNIDIYCIKNPL